MSDESPTLTTIRADAVSVPEVVLVLTSASGARIEQPLGFDAIVIGSDPSADVVLADKGVSRRHCQVTLGEAGVVVRDLGSKNGTFVDGVRVEAATLTAASVLSIGSTRGALRVGKTTEVRISAHASFGDAVGGALAIRALFERLERAATTDETILLLGESGTGKELLARAIHERSRRRAGPFVVFDCAAVASGVIESELFGHSRGAFTGAVGAQPGVFELANGGTLFIDELGELPLDLQPKLLRALEARQVRRLGERHFRDVDVRIVAATHRDVRARVAAGELRQDLYFRLAVVEARVPPLRERAEDIPLLVERMLAAQVPPRGLDALPPNALALLRSHDWPGNVRELRNTVARLVLFPEALAEAISASGGAPAPPAGPTDAALFKVGLREARDLVVESFERRYITHRLAEANGVVAHAAAAMGVSRQFLHRLMERYGIDRGGD